MPTTQQNITWIQLQANGWNRDGARGILPLYNEAQNLLMQQESEQTIQVDPTTGDLPLLTTVGAPTYSYTVPLTIWRVSKILIATPVQNDYDLYILTNYGFDINLQYPIEYFYFAGRKYLRFQQVRTFDKVGTNACRIVFTVDPGAASDIFRYVAHELPTQITSEAIQATIPDRLHQSYLNAATLELISAFQTGNHIKARQYIEHELKPQMWQHMNEGEQGSSGHIARKEF